MQFQRERPPTCADAPVDAAGRRSTRTDRPTRVRYQVWRRRASLAVITYIHRVGFATASAEFKTPLGLTDNHLGWLMAAFMIGYGLFEMPWGFLGDRFGVRHILAVDHPGRLDPDGVPGPGRASCRATSLLIVAFLVVVRFLFGAFQAGTFPSISRMMADWMPTTERGSAQGAIWMSSRIGGALAPLRSGLAVRGHGRLEAAAGARWLSWACLVRGCSGPGFATSPRRCRRSIAPSGS